MTNMVIAFYSFIKMLITCNENFDSSLQLVYLILDSLVNLNK